MRKVLAGVMLNSAMLLAQDATLAIVNASIWTGNPAAPWAEAIAVRGEEIAAVGGTAAIRKLAGANTRVIDGRGRTVVPGFIDSHVHFLDAGFDLTSVQLRDARSKVVGGQIVFERLAQ